METEKQHSSSPKVFVAMAIVIIAMGLIAFGKGGTLSLSNNNLQPTNNGQQQNNQPILPSEPTGPVKVSVDNDPVMGDKNAPVTLIEFSDYDCPFCQSFFQQTLPSIKRDYIDTGKLKLVYRDFPLAFHPYAQKKAEAAECARDQGGDSTYFKFHDAIFADISSDQSLTVAKNIGLNTNAFQSCLDSGKYKDEVSKDVSDASSVGVNGTPSFFVGKSTSNGIIDGTIIVGAQPYSSFQALIDQALSQ